MIRMAGILALLTLLLLALEPSPVPAQSEQQGIAVLKEAKELNDKARSKEDLEKALRKYEEALTIFEQVGSAKGRGVTLNNIGGVYRAWGQYQKALENYEKSLEIARKIGDVQQEGVTLNNIALVYDSWGQYQKALENYEKSLEIARKIGDVKGEGVTLNNIATVYEAWGQYQKALENYEKGLAIQKRIGAPYDGTEDAIGNVYLSMGDMQKAEPLLKKANRWASLGRLALAKSDFNEAKLQYEKALKGWAQSRNIDGLFTGNAGLGLAYEGLQQYDRAADHFRNAIELTEQIRDSLTEAQRSNFYDAQIWNMPRITPYEGLARVLAKQGKGDQSFKGAEATKARAFAESMSRMAQNIRLDVPKSVIDNDTDINNRLAALSQGLQKAYEKGSKDAIESFEKQVKEARQERDRHVIKLRQEYPLFAATKYPQPMDLQHTELKDDQWVLEYEVTDPGICIYLVHGKKIVHALFKPIQRKEIESLVRSFRDPLEITPGMDNITDKLGSFNFGAGKRLSDVLLADILSNLPKGVPLIIVPDECLSVLPFEMLVLNDRGEIRTDKKLPYAAGAEFFGDRNAISYYQSVTALTLARTLQKHGKPSERLLVIADPVFNSRDQRAPGLKTTNIAEADRKFFSDLVSTMGQQTGGGLRFDRLSLTGELAEALNEQFRGNTDKLTGLDATKEKLSAEIAPKMDRYGIVVFATHGYFGNKIPGIMEPILVLTLVPEGTDGFLRMSDVMGLKLSADIVALTACQTGLGHNIAGEGTMGMGRAFQYAGAKSVLMSLWNVGQKASVQLVETFFKHRRAGTCKLEALRLARDRIRKDGFDHPFFWAPFILVGEIE